MQFDIDIFTTLALATAALVIGRILTHRIAFLGRYSIPDAVAGGLVFVGLITAVRPADIDFTFDAALLTPLNVMFFTTVGLSADVRALARGGRLLVLFFVAIAASLVMQNAIGVGLARLFDIHPVNGLLSGSITLAGGHGTGAAWAGKFVEERNLRGAVELAVAASTYGLVIGGVIAGPFASWLLRRQGLSGPADAAPAARPATGAPPAASDAIAFHRVVDTLLLIFIAMAIGFALQRAVGQGAFTLPSFIWALMVGVVIRNFLSLTGLYRVDDATLEFLGTLSLSLFLAMIIMTLKLWELAGLAGPVIVILAVQTIATLAFAAFITFRMTGSNYDAALLATGHVGFSLGSTATAMVTVQSVVERHGHSPLALLLIPVMGAFLIDLANALTIQGFLALPWFTW